MKNLRMSFWFLLIMCFAVEAFAATSVRVSSPPSPVRVYTPPAAPVKVYTPTAATPASKNSVVFSMQKQTMQQQSTSVPSPKVDPMPAQKPYVPPTSGVTNVGTGATKAYVPPTPPPATAPLPTAQVAPPTQVIHKTVVVDNSPSLLETMAISHMMHDNRRNDQPVVVVAPTAAGAVVQEPVKVIPAATQVPVSQPVKSSHINWSFIIWTGIFIGVGGALVYVGINHKSEIKALIAGLKKPATSTTPIGLKQIWVDIPKAAIASVVNPIFRDDDEQHTIVRRETDGDVTLRLLKTLSGNDSLIITNGDPAENRPNSALYFQSMNDFAFLNRDVFLSSVKPGYSFTTILGPELSAHFMNNGETAIHDKFTNLSPADPNIATRLEDTELYYALYQAQSTPELYMLILLDQNDLGRTTYFGFAVDGIEIY